MVIVMIAPAVPMISPVSGFKVVKIRGTFVCTSGKNNVQLRAFNFAANGNRAGFVNLFARVIADDLDLLRIIIDGLVYEHQVSLRSAPSSKIGCGVG